MSKVSTYYLFSFLLFFCNSIGGLTQQNNLDLSPYYSSDHLPEELNRNTLEHANSVSEYYERKFGKDMGLPDDFVYEYSFYLDQINKSGFVLFDNEISLYLNKVKDGILARNDIDHPIEVYLIDYPELNAFTNDFGSIYVNVGSIARLESEQELTFLLAHEISHVLLRHSYNAEIYEKELKEEQWSNTEKTSFKRHAFSRKQELEADSMAVVLVGELLKNDDVSGLMNKLKRASDPIYSGPIDFDLMSFHQEEITDELENRWNRLKYDTINTTIDYINKESTHPDIDLRLKKILSIKEKNFGNNSDYIRKGDYNYFKNIALNLIYKTYLHNEYYIEALDLLLKLRRDNPGNNELRNDQLCVLTLIAQEKYANSTVSILNEYGESCQDQNFLRFKKFILEINAVDMNIINEIASHEFNVSKSIIDENFRMIYRYNEDLFETEPEDSSLFAFVNWDSTLIIRNNFSEYEVISSEITDSLSKQGYIICNSSDTSYLLQHFLSRKLSHTQLGLINLELDRKRKFNGNIPWDEFDLTELNPIKTTRKYTRKNRFLKSDNYDSEKGVAKAIDQSFFVKSRSRSYNGIKYISFLFKFKETLDFRDGFNSSTMDFPVELDISNNSEKNVSISSNYLHRIALSWLNDLSSETLVYSKVNQEMKEQFLDKGISYISVILCVTNKHAAIRHPYTIYYELYFDIENQGIAYISKIGSKQKLNKFQIKQFRYLSDFYKSKNDKNP